VEYEEQHNVNLEEFMTARKAIRSSFVGKLADDLLQERS